MPVIRGEQVISGLDAARPDANGALDGITYVATDTKAVYLCDGSAWRVASALMGPDKASLGPFAAANILACTARAGTAPAGSSGAVMFYPVATPSGVEYFFNNRDTGGARGYVVLCGNNAGDRALIQIYVSGIGYVDVTGATFAGLLNVVHGFAYTFTGGNIRYSLDGAAVVAVALNPAYPVPPNAGDAVTLGGGSASAVPLLSSRLISVVSYTTVVSDADLRVLTGAAARAALRVPAVATGTTDFDFSAARWPSGAGAMDVAADRFLSGASVATLKKNDHS